MLVTIENPNHPKETHTTVYFEPQFHPIVAKPDHHRVENQSLEKGDVRDGEKPTFLLFRGERKLVLIREWEARRLVSGDGNPSTVDVCCVGRKP